MSGSGDRHSKLIAPTAVAPTFTAEEVVKRESENALRQADRMFEMIEHAIAARKPRLRSSTLIELNRLAVAGDQGLAICLKAGHAVREERRDC